MTEIIGNSIEKATQGEYHLKPMAMLQEAWDKVSGSKKTIWGAILFTFLIVIALDVLLGMYMHFFPEPHHMTHTIIKAIFQVPILFITTSLIGGLSLIGIRRATDQKIKAMQVFHCLEFWKKGLKILWASAIFYFFLLVIGFAAAMSFVSHHAFILQHPIGAYALLALGILLGVLYIQITVSFSFYVGLIAERDLGPWQALMTSRKAVNKHWFAFLFSALIIPLLVIIVSSLTAGILFIWTLPMIIIFSGAIYREMFGVQKVTLD